MAPTSSETVTDDGAPVIAFVTRLHAAAKAGRRLLEAVERLDLGDDIHDEREAARAAYDRLAQVKTDSSGLPAAEDSA